MPYQLIDNIRGKVLQEFPTKELAERALAHQSLLDNGCAEIKQVSEPKKKISKKVNTDAAD